MGTPYLAEIRMVSFNFPPKGWAFCNGQILPINQNQALFSLLGTTYGGDGITTFALPNLQGRSPVHMGDGIEIGEAGGEQTHTLVTSEMPSHSHPAVGNSGAASSTSPAAHIWAHASANAYASSANSVMNAAAIAANGGGQPHENMSPFLVVNFVIALQGIFPSRN